MIHIAAFRSSHIPHSAPLALRPSFTATNVSAWGARRRIGRSLFLNFHQIYELTYDVARGRHVEKKKNKRVMTLTWSTIEELT